MPLLNSAPAKNSADSFSQVYAETADFVWRSAKRLVHEDDVDDVVQQVFVKVHLGLGSFEGKSSYKTWTYTILRNVALDHHKAQRRKKQLPADQASPDELEHVAAPSDQSPSAQLDQKHAYAKVCQLLDTLPEPRRQVFELSELEGLSAAEICRALNLSRMTVYALSRAARADFQRALKRASLAPLGAP